MQLVAKFDETEQDFGNSEDFNLRRIVIAGSIVEMRGFIEAKKEGEETREMEEIV